MSFADACLYDKGFEDGVEQERRRIGEAFLRARFQAGTKREDISFDEVEDILNPKEARRGGE